MEKSRQTSTENARIQDVLERYLASRSTLKSSAAETSVHLDEDMISAFSEGTLAQREAAPVVNHLVDCGFCRHRTAELIRLDLELAEVESVITSAPSVEPSKISTVLSEIFTKIFGTTDGAVFAHEEKDEKDTKDSDDNTK